MAKLKMLAIDLGASSGRGIIGEFDGEKLNLKEVCRFVNQPVRVLGSWHWDILRLLHEVKNSLSVCIKSEENIKSLGIDTWGVDFGLLGSDGKLLENPFCYRDSRTDNIAEEAYKKISKSELYNISGLQFMEFNSIYQLLSLKLYRENILNQAHDLLFTPDLLNYFLTGIKQTEYCIASTSGLLNAETRNWDKSLINKMGLPENIFGEIVRPGNILGNLSKDLCEELGINNSSNNIKVINIAEHDTASAVLAVPNNNLNNNDFVYISSGTWSLMGIESNSPIINDLSEKYDFTNEGGAYNKIRFLKNVTGLWLVQECKRAWERENLNGNENVSFEELSQAANLVKPCRSLIDVDLAEFSKPGNMPKRIQEFCARTKQIVPETKGEIIRCVLDSLAIAYRRVFAQIKEVYKNSGNNGNNNIDCINIVGGGVQDKLLCKLTAEACGVRVIAGPIEATAAGNILAQLAAHGEIKGLNEAREVISRSFETVIYEPENNRSNVDLWSEAAKKYEEILLL